MTELIILVAIAIGIGVGAWRYLGTTYGTALRCEGDAIVEISATGERRCVSTAAAGGAAGPPLALAAPPPRAAQPAPVCTGIGCACFVAGTPVMTIDGWRSIEAVVPGQLVLASDDTGGQPLVWRSVARTFAHRAPFVLRLALQGAHPTETDLDVTDGHRLYVAGRGWTRAGDLIPGRDRLIDERGQEVQLLSVASLAGEQTVFNLEVDDAHTYFVSNALVWVHNMCGDPTEDDGVVVNAGQPSNANGSPAFSYYSPNASFGSTASVGSAGGGQGQQQPLLPPLPPPTLPANPAPGLVLGPGAYTFNQPFPGQERRDYDPNNPRTTGTYLNVNDTANLVFRPAAETSIFVSPGRTIAIEANNQPYREPKVFFADPAQIAGWNDTLEDQGSRFRLVDTGQPLTFNDPATNHPVVLHMIEPFDTRRGQQGCAVTTAGDCATTAGQVIGNQRPHAHFPNNHQPRLPDAPPAIANDLIQYQVIGDVLGIPARVDGNLAADPEASTLEYNRFRDPYVIEMNNPRPGNPFDQRLQHYGLNQYAQAQPGEAFVTYMVGQPLPGQPRLPGFHWAGVVAADGNTVITLENYERHHEPGPWNGSTDTRFYFGIYGPPYQTFHQHNSQGVPNTVTMVYQHDAPPPRNRWRVKWWGVLRQRLHLIADRRRHHRH